MSNKQRLTIRPWLVAGVVCLAVGLGQPPAPCAAPPAADGPRRTVTDRVPGVNIFSPQRWGIVGVEIANPGDAPAEVLSSHYFPGDPNLQFARRLWIPPHAKRSSWYPVLPPGGPLRGMSLPVQSLLIDRSQGKEILLGEPGRTLVHEGMLPAQSDNAPVTGLIADPDDAEVALPVQVARVALRRSPRIARLDGDALPPTADSLQALDQLVVASDRPAADAAGLRAIRGWLHAGGRLWVRLDRVSTSTVALLLGEDCPCTVVDRVGLTRWQFSRERPVADPDDEVFNSSAAPPAAVGETAVRVEGAIGDFEAPVEMVRVLAADMPPVHTVEGWPASFWRRCGRGLVLFTTVGPRAWVCRRSQDDPRTADRNNPVARFKETEPLLEVATPFLRPRQGPPLKAEAFGSFLGEQVGHGILGRGVVAAVLGAFCLGLAAAAWGLRRHGSLAPLGWAGPAAALGVALLLTVLGYQARGRIPPTAAMAQLVEVTPGTEEAAVTGLLALYDLNEAPFPPPGATRGGVFLPDLKGQGGTTRRMVWTDLDRWHWENLALPPGLHLATFEVTAPITEPVSARVTLGPEGIIGTLAPGPFRGACDAILTFSPRRNLTVRFTGAAGDFMAGPGDRLAPGQFLAADILSDEQRRRQIIYKKLLDRPAGPRYPARPTLFAWTSPLDVGFTFPEETQQTGAALVAIPLTIDRPVPGTRVTIPAPLLSYRCVVRPDLALLYAPERDEWVSARRQSARTILRFQVPPELLPLHIERAVLEVDLNAQARPFEVFADAGPGAEVLASRYSPVGKFRLVIDRPDALRPDAGGGIYLGLAIGEAARLPGEASASSDWKINDLQLELTGRTPED